MSNIEDRTQYRWTAIDISSDPSDVHVYQQGRKTYVGKTSESKPVRGIFFEYAKSNNVIGIYLILKKPGHFDTYAKYQLQGYLSKEEAERNVRFDMIVVPEGQGTYHHN